jgi:aquaporin Z
MKTILIEFVGTLIFVLTFGLTLVPPSVGPFAPLAIGLMLAAMVYVGGPVSGGHYNPAVTLAVWLRGKCAGRVVVPYVLAQLVAGALAGILVNYLRTGGIAASTVPVVHDVLKLGVVEFVFTFALAYVFLTVATSSKSAGNSYSGFAVGATMLAGMYAGLPLSGGAYNPAVAVGASLMGLGSWDLLWIYIIAQLAAGSVAAIMYKTMNSEEFQK